MITALHLPPLTTPFTGTTPLGVVEAMENVSNSAEFDRFMTSASVPDGEAKAADPQPDPVADPDHDPSADALSLPAQQPASAMPQAQRTPQDAPAPDDGQMADAQGRPGPSNPNPAEFLFAVRAEMPVPKLHPRHPPLDNSRSLRRAEADLSGPDHAGASEPPIALAQSTPAQGEPPASGAALASPGPALSEAPQTMPDGRHHEDGAEHEEARSIPGPRDPVSDLRSKDLPEAQATESVTTGQALALTPQDAERRTPPATSAATDPAAALTLDQPDPPARHASITVPPVSGPSRVDPFNSGEIQTAPTSAMALPALLASAAKGPAQAEAGESALSEQSQAAGTTPRQPPTIPPELVVDSPKSAKLVILPELQDSIAPVPLPAALETRHDPPQKIPDGASQQTAPHSAIIPDALVSGSANPRIPRAEVSGVGQSRAGIEPVLIAQPSFPSASADSATAPSSPQKTDTNMAKSILLSGDAAQISLLDRLVAIPTTGDIGTNGASRPEPSVTQDPAPPRSAPSPLAALIIERAQHAPAGPVTIILRPEDLGTLTFEVRQTVQGVHLHLSVDQPATLDLLRRQGEQMLNDLRQAGFAGATLSYSEGHASAGGGSGGTASTAPHTASDLSESPATTPPPSTTALRPTQPAAPGTLNLRL